MPVEQPTWRIHICSETAGQNDKNREFMLELERHLLDCHVASIQLPSEEKTDLLRTDAVIEMVPIDLFKKRLTRLHVCIVPNGSLALQVAFDNETLQVRNLFTYEQMELPACDAYRLLASHLLDNIGEAKGRRTTQAFEAAQASITVIEASLAGRL